MGKNSEGKTVTLDGGPAPAVVLDGLVASTKTINSRPPSSKADCTIRVTGWLDRQKITAPKQLTSNYRATRKASSS